MSRPLSLSFTNSGDGGDFIGEYLEYFRLRVEGNIDAACKNNNEKRSFRYFASKY